MTSYLGVKYFLANQITSLVLFRPCRLGFSASHYRFSCVVSLVSVLVSILGLVTGSPAGASLRVYVPVVGTGVLGFDARWIGHCRPLWPATMWENKVSHLGNSLIMIITAKILKYS